MNDKNKNLFETLETAFKEASEFLDLKEKIDVSINEISKMLMKMTNDRARLRIDMGTRRNYTATSFVIIAVDSPFSQKDIFLCGFSADEIRGFPVVVETDDDIENCDTPEELKYSLVELISQPYITTKILSIINETSDDIPF